MDTFLGMYLEDVCKKNKANFEVAVWNDTSQSS